MISAAYTRAAAAAPRMLSLVPSRTFVLSALTRSSLPRHLFPCDMLLARNASQAAAAARMPNDVYDAPPPAAHEKDPATAFSTLEDTLHPDTLRAITEHPFQHTHMSSVQARIFPLLPHLAEAHHHSNDTTRPRDLLVKAKTGTGKTMAFLVPSIEARRKAVESHVAQAKIDSGLGDKWTRADSVRSAKAYATEHVGTLILSPTRELATQIAVEAGNLSTHHQGFQVQVLLGGESRRAQIRSWERGRKDIVVATPGRLMDLLDSEPMFAAALQGTKILVLDEADTLLDMGFRDDIERISARLPSAPVRQTFLFSATVSRPIQEIARKLLAPQHTFVNCVAEDDVATHTHIPQYTTTLPSGADAIPHLLRLIAHDQLLCAQEGRKSKVIVFLSTTKMTQLVADILSAAAATTTPRRARGHDVSQASKPALFPMATRTYEMHAKRDMSRRIAVSASFRNDVAANSGAVLITSDVSARGVDYPGVTRVIQLGVPASPDLYVHRVGRTGRGGDRGGRGRADIILSGEWEAPAVARIARAVGVKANSVTVDKIERECEAMVAGAKGTAYGQANLGEIAPWAATLTQRIGHPDYIPPGGPAESSYPGRASSETISSAFLAQLGFYLGRQSTTGLAATEVAKGLQKFFRDMCALTRDITISRTLMAAMGGGGGFGGRRVGGGGGFDRRGSSGGRSFGGGFDRGDSGGSYERRGSEGREGYRSRSGGAFGYTPAAPSRRLGAWEGATGRGGSARPAYGSGLYESGGGGGKPSWGASDRASRDTGDRPSWGGGGGDRSPRPTWQDRRSMGDRTGRGEPPLFYGGGSSAAPERTSRGRGAKYSRDDY